MVVTWRSWRLGGVRCDRGGRLPLMIARRSPTGPGVLRIRCTIAGAVLLTLAVPVSFAQTPGPATNPAQAPNASLQPSGSVSPIPTEQDDEAQRQELERQKAPIDQKLAEIDARRRARSSTTTSALPQTAPAAPPGAEAAGAPSPTDVEWYNIHAQTSVITQWHDAFPAPYSGAHSLQRHESAKTSITATLFGGLRLPWEGGAIYFDPELAGGEGFSGVQGIAGFPNGEIPRVGSPSPQVYVARAYYQQDFGLGGEKEHVDSGQNQLAGYRDPRRFTLSLGRFAATDFFDDNAYSHDPRSQFMNWSLMDDTAWDYPADTRGYSVGAVAEYNEPAWALRYGIFQEPKEANGGSLDGHFPKASGNALEFEDRWSFGDRPGTARLMGFVNFAHMGNYRQAIDKAGAGVPDVTATRTYSTKYGISLSAEQALTPELGLWGRAGWNDGHTESWAFTEVDRQASLGISLKGTQWGRPDDVFGFAGAIEGLSEDHRDYLRRGGLGFILGDGKLTYAPEEILESYYLFKAAEHVFITPDVQFINHPAYNSDRGPVFVGGVRAHIEF